MSSKQSAVEEKKAPGEEQGEETSGGPSGLARTKQIHPATILRRASLDRRTLTPQSVLQLQTSIGNRATRRVLAQAARQEPGRNHNNDPRMETATQGTRGPGAPLPHGDVIQRSFGRHDVHGIRAYVGGEASRAAADLGAEAYAVGGSVAFAAQPGLHTAAHEAAHVIQQRAGVHLKGGVGEEGDRHERHADAVADRVARGLSAESLLDDYVSSARGGAGDAAPPPPVIQRTVMRGQRAVSKRAFKVWAESNGRWDGLSAALRTEIKNLLTKSSPVVRVTNMEEIIDLAQQRIGAIAQQPPPPQPPANDAANQGGNAQNGPPAPLPLSLEPIGDDGPLALEPIDDDDPPALDPIEDDGPPALAPIEDDEEEDTWDDSVIPVLDAKLEPNAQPWTREKKQAAIARVNIENQDVDAEDEDGEGLDDGANDAAPLKDQLANPPPLSPAYASFCDILFGKQDLMETMSIEKLDDAIYEIYVNAQGQADPEIKSIEDETQARTALNLWKTLHAIDSSAVLQGEGVNLKKVVETIDLLEEGTLDDSAHEKALEDMERWLTAFIYFTAKGGSVSHRVYANIKMASAETVTRMLIKQPGVSAFKLAGPTSFGARADSLVVYCNRPFDATIVSKRLEQSGIEVRPWRTAMTEKSGGNEGIGIGAEPAWMRTGMRADYKTKKGGRAQSFGTIRAEIIASAILHYRINKDRTADLKINEKELFKRFVAIGVKGWSRFLEPA